MSDHPIQGLMKTAMEQITEMVNVNTIVGDPIETGAGDVIMPISRVNFGFAAGGSDFGKDEAGEEAKNASVNLPFGGGSGGGVSITPIAFLVVGKSGVKIVPLDNQTHLIERLIDSAPGVVDRIQSMIQGAAHSDKAGAAGHASTGVGTGTSVSGGHAMHNSGYGSGSGTSGNGYVSSTHEYGGNTFSNGVTEAYASGGAGFPGTAGKSED